MARKPGKPTRPKRDAKRAGKPVVEKTVVKKTATNPRRKPAVAVPSANDDAVLEEIDSSLARPFEPSDDAPIEVSEFHPVESEHTDAQDGEEATDAESDEDASSSKGAVVAVDPLSRYLAEIRRFPLLTREEEAVIARRYIKENDPADAYRLVTANLRLVVKIAFEFARATRNALDLIQEGNVGLMEAVKNFDPEHGVRFPSYAVWWVRAYIYRYLINNSRLVKIGTTQAQRKLFFNLRKETERLEREGFKPQPLLLAHRMGVKESEVREMQERMGQSEVSLDQPAGASEETRLLDVIPDAGHNPETETADREWRDFAREKVAEFAAKLEGKELEIFNARLRAEDPETLQDIGVRFGISRERVRQIETRLKRRLKEFIEATAPDVDDAGPS
ncbi:MAG TPA: RNA polymerase factor sigma-32 [Methylomirabilota bacterium]|nr:RNA polymerase factor sigma-32 [Methylomirabilota bacterium]